MATSPGQYRVTLPDGRDLIVDLAFRDGRWVARVDGAEHALRMRRGSNGETVVDVDGDAYRLRGQNGSTRLVGASGEVAVQALSVRDAGTDQLAAVTPPGGNFAVAGKGASLGSPLTGLVAEVRVRAGERVTRGQTLLVIEAMKMENRITAPTDAEVRAVRVEVGATVRVGDPLVEWAAAS